MEKQAEERFTPLQEEVLKALARQGVSPAKAAAVVRCHDCETILSQIEYAEFVAVNDKRNKIQNLAGFVIYMIENDVPVPTGFVNTRKRAENQQQAAAAAVEDLSRSTLQLQYQQFVFDQLEAAISQRFPGAQLARKLKEMTTERRRSDDRFDILTPDQQSALVLQSLRQEIKESTKVGSFGDWCEARKQTHLFS